MSRSPRSRSRSHISRSKTRPVCHCAHLEWRLERLTRVCIDYAKKHGYDFYIDYESTNNRGMMWHKFDMVQNVINGSEHDWVWWMDFDTLITNTNTKLEDIISEALANATDPDLVDYIFTPDWYVHYLFSRVSNMTYKSYAFYHFSSSILLVQSDVFLALALH